jgi:hypothetical protein
MIENKITTLYKGKYVLVVEDNVYSRSEAIELIAELEQAEPFLATRPEEDLNLSRGFRG